MSSTAPPCRDRFSNIQYRERRKRHPYHYVNVCTRNCMPQNFGTKLYIPKECYVFISKLRERAPPPSPSPRRLALGARNVCLVGENPTCSVPALWVREGLIARVLRTTPPCMVRSLPLPARPSPAAIRPCHEGVIV